MLPTIRPTTSPIQSQLEAYQHSQTRWSSVLSILPEANPNPDLEETMEVGLACGRLLERATQNWRERVFRGVELYAADANIFYLQMHQLWLDVTDSLLKNVAQRTSNGDRSEIIDALGSYVKSTRERLQNWRVPAISSRIGLREIQMDMEQAISFDTILADTKVTPSVMPEVPGVIEISVSEFLARIKPH